MLLEQPQIPPFACIVNHDLKFLNLDGAKGVLHHLNTAWQTDMLPVGMQRGISRRLHFDPAHLAALSTAPSPSPAAADSVTLCTRTTPLSMHA